MSDAVKQFKDLIKSNEEVAKEYDSILEAASRELTQGIISLAKANDIDIADELSVDVKRRLEL